MNCTGFLLRFSFSEAALFVVLILNLSWPHQHQASKSKESSFLTSRYPDPFSPILFDSIRLWTTTTHTQCWVYIFESPFKAFDQRYSWGLPIFVRSRRLTACLLYLTKNAHPLTPKPKHVSRDPREVNLQPRLPASNIKSSAIMWITTNMMREFREVPLNTLSGENVKCLCYRRRPKKVP